MSKDLLDKLRNTKAVTLPRGVVRTLDDAELAAVAGGMRRTGSYTCSGGYEDDCCD